MNRSRSDAGPEASSASPTSSPPEAPSATRSAPSVASPASRSSSAACDGNTTTTECGGTARSARFTADDQLFGVRVHARGGGARNGRSDGFRESGRGEQVESSGKPRNASAGHAHHAPQHAPRSHQPPHTAPSPREQPQTYPSNSSVEISVTSATSSSSDSVTPINRALRTRSFARARARAPPTASERRKVSQRKRRDRKVQH